MDVTDRSKSFAVLRKATGPVFIDPARLQKIDTLGSGAFAVVHLCLLSTEGAPDRKVAVKRLRESLFHDSADVADFVREGTLLAGMHHPHILPVLGLGFDAAEASEQHPPPLNSLFIVEEACFGGTLGDKIRRKHQSLGQSVYTYAEGAEWIRDVAKALAYLHGGAGGSFKEVIHRDVKPANVMLYEDENRKLRVKLGDFGLAAKVECRQNHHHVTQLKKCVADEGSRRQGSLPTEDDSARHETDQASPKFAKTPSPTSEGQRAAPRPSGSSDSLQVRLEQTPQRSKPSVMQRAKSFAQVSHSAFSETTFDLTSNTGSFLHMAPEVILGRRYNKKADIFSLGVVLFATMSGTPFGVDVIPTGATEEYQQFAAKVAGGFRRPNPYYWPPLLADLVTDCLAQNHRDRPTADQVVSRLQTLIDSGEMSELDRNLSGCNCCCIQ